MKNSGEDTLNGNLLPLCFSLLAGCTGMTIAFGIDGNTSWILVIGQWGFLNSIACFFIVRSFPSSAWFVWFTCNVMIFVAGLIDKRLWISDMWKGYLLMFILTILGVITGIIFRKRKFNGSVL